MCVLIDLSVTLPLNTIRTLCGLQCSKVYIKDADEWKKDTDDKTKFKNVIEKVATKGRKNVTGWQRSHPEVCVLDSNDYEMNHKILRHTWGDGDTEKLQEKVIRNLAKEVHVDRLSK